MDHADLFQCPRGDLPSLHGRSGPGLLRHARTGALHRAALLCARRSDDSYLHGGFAFLWGQGMAGVPQNRASHMTRRGTLAYYLAAWVIGCFVVSFLQWVGEALGGEIQTASILLTTYFFSLVFGAAAILLFAFLLRRWMRLLGTHAQWAWFVSGGALALV